MDKNKIERKLNKPTISPLQGKPVSEYRGIPISVSKYDRKLLSFDSQHAVMNVDEVTQMYGLKDKNTGFTIIGDELEDIEGSTRKLYAYALSILTKNNSKNIKKGELFTEVTLSVKDFCDISIDEKELTGKPLENKKAYIKRKFNADVTKLQKITRVKDNLDNEYQVWIKKTPIQNGVITLTLNPLIVSWEHRFFFYVPPALMQAPDRAFNMALNVVITTFSQYRAEQGTNTVISTKSLLHLCQCENRSLPTYEDVEKGNKDYNHRIVKPFFENYLDACDKLFTWQFRTGRNTKTGSYTYLSKEEALKLSYQDFIKGYIDFKPLYEHTTYAEVLAITEKKQQEKLEAQNKAIKANYAKKDRAKKA